MKKEFLRDHKGNLSMMRLAMLCVIIMAGILFIAITVYIIISSLKQVEINFSGMAVLVGALSAFIGAIIFGKTNQKGKELRSKIDKIVDGYERE